MPELKVWVSREATTGLYSNKYSLHTDYDIWLGKKPTKKTEEFPNSLPDIFYTSRKYDDKYEACYKQGKKLFGDIKPGEIKRFVITAAEISEDD